ncbi:MAG: DUF4432 family protein [Bacteroidota bacterium]
MEKPVEFRFNCRALSLNRERVIEAHGFRAEIIHRKGDPDHALRIILSGKDLEVELLPSKGLSVGEVFYDKQPLFWEPPAGLPDPDELELTSSEVMVNGEKAEGFTYLKTFMAGIELYGLRNWGMPRTDEQTGEVHPLHGETSNIPVREVTGLIERDHAELKGTFLYRRFTRDGERHWYDRGEPLYEVTRKVAIPSGGSSFGLTDSIKNLTGRVRNPDWGYHITFRPENGSRLLVPSKHVEERSGGKLPGDIETWRPAEDPRKRMETGIIHKELNIYRVNGRKVNKVLLHYPSGRGISLSFPVVPYFQTWFCNGGANTTEFTYAENGNPVLTRNWDGQGIEIGSGPLDHDGNIDRSVDYKETLGPGEVLENEIRIEMLTDAGAQELVNDIRDFQDR